jgi:hypothetical protein
MGRAKGCGEGVNEKTINTHIAKKERNWNGRGTLARGETRRDETNDGTRRMGEGPPEGK